MPALPLPALPASLPGWTWFQNQSFNFAIAYPLAWTASNGYRDGEFILTSPESNSEVRIDVWDTPAQGDWLDWVRDNPARLALTLPSDSISTNATFLGQPAFFHFQPASGGGGDMASLIFSDGDSIFNLLYHSGKIPALKAEATIYRHMLTTFTRPAGTAAALSVPTGWEKGATLVIWRNEVDLATLPADALAVYHEGLTGTVASLDPGELVLLADNGQSYTLSTVGYYFMGMDKTMSRVNAIGGHVEEGDRIFFIGQPLVSERVKPQYLAVEREGRWEPYAYQSFFDLSRETLDPAVLTLYPQVAGPIRLWLRGTMAQVQPYLVDEQGNAFAVTLFAADSAQDTLAYGVLRTPADPRLILEELYVLEGECVVISNYEEDCFSWQQVFPPPPATTITATALQVVPESGVIVLERPVEGFITVTLAEEGQLLTEEGQPATWEALRTGVGIRAVGEANAAGTLLAQQIVIADD